MFTLLYTTYFNCYCPLYGFCFKPTVNSAYCHAECWLTWEQCCTVLFWTWNVLWIEVKAEVVETALALLPLTLFILYVTFSGRGERCCEGLCNRSSRSHSNVQPILCSLPFGVSSFPPLNSFSICSEKIFYLKFNPKILINLDLMCYTMQKILKWPWVSFHLRRLIVFVRLWQGTVDTRRRKDDVSTGRDNGKRRMSSFHSSISLDVTLHLFISSLTTGSKGGWIGGMQGNGAGNIKWHQI